MNEVSFNLLRQGAMSRPTAKVIQIAILLLITLIANEMISGVVFEREYRQSGLLDELRSSWGPEQTVHAPILVIPYSYKGSSPRQFMKISPSSMSSVATLAPERKKRGLFEATVYQASIEMTGRFSIPDEQRISEIIEKGYGLLWEEAFIALETSKLSGMSANDSFKLDDQILPWRSCREISAADSSCQNGTLIALPRLKGQPKAGAEIAFSANLTLRGSQTFFQFLEGRSISAAISAPWATPSFTGDMSPSSSIVEENHFEGRWDSYDHSFPQLWISHSVLADSVSGSKIGVELMEKTPTYRMIERVSKYAILFVVLSFTAYFLFELLSGIRIHAIQYGLLGVSLTLFGLLLLSFGEILGYAAGYLIAAALVLAQSSLYTWAVTRRMRPTLIFCAILAALFAFLYVLLSLENYSLLLGSVALFVVLSIVMTLTQKVNWWDEKNGTDAPDMAAEKI